MTFSIIGLDSERGLIGSAVASKWTSVGGCVPFFRPGIGLAHVQGCAYARTAENIWHAMTEDGMTPDAAVADALSRDTGADHRQVLVMDLAGRSAVVTGAACQPHAAHQTGINCIAAGNTLANDTVVPAMVAAFDSMSEALLGARLLAALEAGEAAGGDARGREAAALRIYTFDYPDQRFFPLDIRVDSHDDPLLELRRLYDVFLEIDRQVIV